MYPYKSVIKVWQYDRMRGSTHKHWEMYLKIVSVQNTELYTSGRIAFVMVLTAVIKFETRIAVLSMCPGVNFTRR